MLRSFAKRLLRHVPGFRDIANVAHGEAGIREVGHRDYVGGLWDELGVLQFDFLRGRGLEPHHYLVDIACGSLRAGVHLIPYLEPGHYLGIEKEASLIESGIDEEIGREMYEARRPEFVVSDAFDFERFSARPDFALAQSLFSHLPAEVISQCLAKLRPVMNPGGVLFATYVVSDREVENPDDAHDHLRFAYTRAQMEAFGREHGFTPEYMGEWGHPRGQVMVAYRVPAA